MVFGILKEESPERRVCLLPESVAALVKMNMEVFVERDAGATAFAATADYEDAGATTASKEEVIRQSGFLFKINGPTQDELALMHDGQLFLGSFNPLIDTDLVRRLAEKNITSFSLDVIPRITRAQAMDVLSSMATIAGYKAVLTAANTSPRFFPMFMTAAGTITPSKVLILGAGVAGLQAIAVARKLGAVVQVFDVRAAVKEEVTGLGAKFVEVEGATDDRSAGGYAVEQTEEFKDRQAKVIHDHALKSDVIICTAQIPGKRAPLLLKKETVEAMRPGSVIVDLAASTGGNCELTLNNETVMHNRVTIIGNSGFAAEMPSDASKMFGKNVLNFLKLMFNSKGEFFVNWDDEIVKGTCVTHQGEILHERVKAK